MSSFIDENLIEINWYPRYGDFDLFTIKDYFYYNSNTQCYSHKDLVVPVSQLINKNELPSEEVIRRAIDKQLPVMKRTRSLKDQKEVWSFEVDNLKEDKVWIPNT